MSPQPAAERKTIACFMLVGCAICLLSSRVNSAAFGQTNEATEQDKTEATLTLQSAEEQFASKLKRLEEICERLQLPSEASISRGWLPSQRNDHEILYLTGSEPEQTQDTAQTQGEDQATQNAKSSWRRHFQSARVEFADAVFEAAKQTVAKNEAAAYRLLWRVLRENPEHAEAKRILGFLGKSPTAGNRLVRGRQPLRDLGWEAGDYSKIESPHFSILTHADAKTSREITRQLETFYALWTQVFYPYWAKPGQLKAKFDGANRLWPRLDKSQILILRDRREYTQVLGVNESNIGVSVGYYNPNVLKSAFYPGDGIDSLRPTLFHEVTHQLIMEATRNDTKSSAGQQGGIWLLEGIALYMESLKQHETGYWTIGGWDAARMQTARYRAVRDGYWPNWQAFADGEVGAWKTDPEIARLYTHAYGLTQTLLHRSEESRSEYFRQLMSVYQGRNQSSSLLSNIASDEAAAKESYPESLIVQPEQLDNLLSDVQRGKTPPRDLVLTGSDLPQTSWHRLANLKQLEWFDISFSNVTDEDLDWLGDQQQLTRLSLEGTAITRETVERAAMLPGLKELDLSGCQISGSDLESLASHPTLEILWLTQSGIDADALPVLESMTKLTTVDISGTKIGAKIWDEFVAANPRFSK